MSKINMGINSVVIHQKEFKIIWSRSGEDRFTLIDSKGRFYFSIHKSEFYLTEALEV
jgi:hypothetical protein